MNMNISEFKKMVINESNLNKYKMIKLNQKIMKMILYVIIQVI